MSDLCAKCGMINAVNCNVCSIQTGYCKPCNRKHHDCKQPTQVKPTKPVNISLKLVNESDYRLIIENLKQQNADLRSSVDALKMSLFEIDLDRQKEIQELKNAHEAKIEQLNEFHLKSLTITKSLFNAVENKPAVSESSPDLTNDPTNAQTIAETIAANEKKISQVIQEERERQDNIDYENKIDRLSKGLPANGLTAPPTTPRSKRTTLKKSIKRV